MTFYASAAQTAARLIRQYGARAQLSRFGPGAEDPDTLVITPSQSSADVDAVVFPGAGYRYVDGTQVQQGDQYGFLATPGVNPPKVGDTLTWSGAPLGVIKVSILAPAGAAVLYEVGLRG